MAFSNINTLFHAIERGEQEAFHTAFEEAYAKVVAGLGQTHKNVVGGESLSSTNGTFASHSPWDRELVVGHFPDSSAEEAQAAVRAARAAFPGWQRTSHLERADFLDRVADAMTRRFHELCAAMTVEVGKTRAEASIDVDEGIDFCRSYANQVRESDGFVTKMGVPFPGEECSAHWRPYGVFGVIAPFNFPIAITMGMTVGAVVTGNTVVLKPAEQAPWCGQLVFECLTEAGLPTGVVNLVHGNEKAGQGMVDDKGIDGFVFTGSKGVGLHILNSTSTDRPRPVIAEMGGKNAVIVMPSADLEKAAQGVFNAAFGFSGQKCSACSRLYLHESIKDTFMNAFMMHVMNVVVGHPSERDTWMGPVVEEATVERYLAAAELARKDGVVITGGDRMTDGDFAKGLYVAPTVVDGLPKDHELFHKELFAPFVALTTIDSLDEGLKLVNSVEYGLTAGIFSEDEDEIAKFFDEVEAGVTYANRRRGGSTGAVVDGQVFVGWKNSGTTGRGAGGRNYLTQFMREQSRTRVRE